MNNISHGDYAKDNWYTVNFLFTETFGSSSHNVFEQSFVFIDDKNMFHSNSVETVR